MNLSAITVHECKTSGHIDVQCAECPLGWKVIASTEPELPNTQVLPDGFTLADLMEVVNRHQWRHRPATQPSEMRTVDYPGVYAGGANRSLSSGSPAHVRALYPL